MTNGTLTADGARYLRMARAKILAHPETFDMAEWDCGTTACIAGHIARLIPELGNGWSTRDVSAALGFGRTTIEPWGHPLSFLFYSNLPNSDPAWAAAKITEFLWQYGY